MFLSSLVKTRYHSVCDTAMCASIIQFRAQILVIFAGIGTTLQGVGLKQLPNGLSNVFYFSFTAGLLELIYVGCIRLALNMMRTGPPTSSSATVSWNVAVLLTIRSVLGFVGTCFAFLAIGLLPLGEATALFMTSPMFATVGACALLQEQVLPREWGSLLACFLGALCIVLPPCLGAPSHEQADAVRGAIYALCTALCSAGSYLVIRTMGTRVRTRWTNISFAHAAGQLLGSSSCLLAMSLLATATHPHAATKEAMKLQLGGDAPSFSWTSMPTLVTAASAGAFSHIAMTYGIRKCKAAQTGVMRGAEVLWGFLAQIWLTEDQVQPAALLGGLLIVSSILTALCFTNNQSDAAPVVASETSALLGSGPEATYQATSAPTPGFTTPSAGRDHEIVGEYDSHEDDDNDEELAALSGWGYVTPASDMGRSRRSSSAAAMFMYDGVAVGDTVSPTAAEQWEQSCAGIELELAGQQTSVHKYPAVSPHTLGVINQHRAGGRQYQHVVRVPQMQVPVTDATAALLKQHQEKQREQQQQQPPL